VPWGLLNLATGAVLIVFGTSRETSDFWADCLWLWWERVGRHCAGLKRLRIRLDNGPNCASTVKKNSLAGCRRQSRVH
jgi:Rhodopirellula transposase DDE domain